MGPAVSLVSCERALVDAALGSDAALAEALAAPSGRVLEKSGFVRDGENIDGDVGVVWRYRHDRGTARTPGDPRTPTPGSG